MFDPEGNGMKKPVELALLTLLFIGVSFGQTATTRTEKKDGVRSRGGIAEVIIAREEGFWDAWKNRRADFFKANLTEDSIVMVGTGPKGKSQVVRDISKAD